VLGACNTGTAANNAWIAHGIKLINSKSDDVNKITGAQLRAARAMIRWSAKDLAKAAEIGVATVSRAEVEDGVPSITNANLKAMQLALEAAGIEFTRENGSGVGVRFKKPE
jgi:DNA-binding XRE family transcriptional regulator